MRVRGILLLLLAIVVGATAVYLARGWIESQVPEPVVITEEKVPLTTVVVARRNLFFGDRLRDDFLEERSWPSETVPEGSFAKIEELTAEERVVIRQIARNEPILRSKITGEDGRASLSAQITSSMRAITIRVNDILGVAGFVLPGDRVDLLLTREISDNNPVTSILLQNVKILGIDQNADEASDGTQLGNAATMEVTPEQAQRIVLATTVGEISLALRNYIDVDPAVHRPVTLADLGTGEINTSPNAQISDLDLSGDAAASLPEDKAEVTISERLTGGNPGLSVTVTRGLQSKQYRVEPSANTTTGGSSLRTPPAPTQVTPPAQPSGIQLLPNTITVPGSGSTTGELGVLAVSSAFPSSGKSSAGASSGWTHTCVTLRRRLSAQS